MPQKRFLPSRSSRSVAILFLSVLGVILTKLQTGLESVDFDGVPPEIGSARKRKLDQARFEVPDSEDDDYGWQEDDESALPHPPPQWQGSEDVLLGTYPETDDDGSNVDDT